MPRKTLTLKQRKAIQAANNPEPRGTITTLQRIRGQKKKIVPLRDQPPAKTAFTAPKG